MSILPLPDAIHRFKGNDERVDILVNGGDTATWTQSGGTVQPSMAKFLKDNQDQIDALTQDLNAYLGYTMVIESSLGTVFRLGEATPTTLIARVFRNGAEITSEVPASWFRWRRVSRSPQPFPNDDATWNSIYQVGGYKTINVSLDTTNGRASFFCDLQPPT